MFIGDYENSRIRRVDPDGTITTVAGNGEVGTGGDGGPATEAQLESPYGLDVDGAGNLYIADEENAWSGSSTRLASSGPQVLG